MHSEPLSHAREEAYCIILLHCMGVFKKPFLESL
jgi:hypothetical protein